ncbi:MAG: hypothetical protein K0S12_494, partial [Bacteroidetes bacterium]|nr:hypothetical protein [Bacteroidota bacterium]
MIQFRLVIILLLAIQSTGLFSQCITPVNFQLQKELPANPFPNIHHDLT